MLQHPLVEQLAAVLTSRQRLLRHVAELTSRKRSRQLAAAHVVQGTNNLSKVFRNSRWRSSAGNYFNKVTIRKERQRADETVFRFSVAYHG
jgi:hypothetical protein